MAQLAPAAQASPDAAALAAAEAAGSQGQAAAQKVYTGPVVAVQAPFAEIHVHEVQHLKSFVADLKQYANRFVRTKCAPCQGPDSAPDDVAERIHEMGGVGPDDLLLEDIVVKTNERRERVAFLRAGYRSRIVWAPQEVSALIVTCGGLCPGLNDVVFEIVNMLYYNYGVNRIFGSRYGYRGFYAHPWVELTPEVAKQMLHKGGSELGSSRGGFDLGRMIDALERGRINQVYVIGGDGTLRGAAELSTELAKRKKKIVVAAIPKTIDNDIPVIDRSFGFNTAVAQAYGAINSARIEAEGTPGGVGIVRLMGRECGLIAAHATLASRQVDVCLVPEINFKIDGPTGVLEHIERLIRMRGKAVVVVAEGAGQQYTERTGERDPSGNPVLGDFALLLRTRLGEHLKKRGVEHSIKYHDPSYMIRSVPADPADSIFCLILAQNAVHGAMAGYTSFVSAIVNNRTVYLPIQFLCSKPGNRLNPQGHTWERVVSSTHQPDFT